MARPKVGCLLHTLRHMLLSSLRLHAVAAAQAPSAFRSFGGSTTSALQLQGLAVAAVNARGSSMEFSAVSDREWLDVLDVATWKSQGRAADASASAFAVCLLLLRVLFLQSLTGTCLTLTWSLPRPSTPHT